MDCDVHQGANQSDISCNPWLHMKELVLYQFSKRLHYTTLLIPFCCHFVCKMTTKCVTNLKIGEDVTMSICYKSTTTPAILLMALPRKVAVRFAHIHNTPGSHTLSVWDDDIVYSHGNMGQKCIASWGWRRSQGFGCSPIKAVRELGLVRREAVRFLSSLGVWPHLLPILWPILWPILSHCKQCYDQSKIGQRIGYNIASNVTRLVITLSFHFVIILFTKWRNDNMIKLVWHCLQYDKAGGGKELRESFLCTRGPGMVNLWSASCLAKGIAG